jgi:hypothetical protein
MNTEINKTYNPRSDESISKSNYAFYSDHYTKLMTTAQQYLNSITVMNICTSTLPTSTNSKEEKIYQLLKAGNNTNDIDQDQAPTSEEDPTKL